jgi:hypothetical protein
MAYLFQDSTPISDSPYISGSIWFRVPSANDTDNLSPNLITISSLSDICPLFYGFTTGVGTGGGGEVHSEDNRSASFATTHDLLCNVWHHVAFGADFNHRGVYVDDSAQSINEPMIFNTVFDGVARAVTGNINFSGNGTEGPISIPFIGKSIGIPDLPSTYVDGTLDVPRFGPQMEFGDYQMWMGTYIDWTDGANFANVVKISEGKGTPVDPAVAAAAFGHQTLLFKGNHTNFQSNLGTAGSFSQIGTSVDFTPTPSYG